MTPTIVLLNIIGGICVMLYGLRQIKRGVMRAFGADLRQFVAACTRLRVTGFLAGMGAAFVLQSSIAVSLLLATFVGQKMLTTAAALAVVLGADLGITLVAQLLTFDVSWLGPLLLLIGLLTFTTFERHPKAKHIGLAVFGLGLMLFAMAWIKLASVPFKESEALPYLIKPLEIDPVLTLIVGALVTWLLHSSLAFVLLIVSFAAADIISPHLALLLVLGANIGSVLVPLFATFRDEDSSVRIPFANLLMRLSLIVVLLPFLKDIQALIAEFDGSIGRQIVHFHFAFNLTLALLFLPFTGVVAWIVHKLIPDKFKTSTAATPMYLDAKQLDTPAVALSSAARETLRIADLVQAMLEKTLEAFKTRNNTLIETIRDMDTTVDTLHKAIKHYLADAMRMALDEKEAQRHMQIFNFATSLEQVGDTIDKSLMSMAEKMISGRKKFSPQGMTEIENLFALTIDSLRLAQTVFMSSDIALARKLVEGKAQVKAAERKASAGHFKRLREGVAEAVETSSVHLDLIRDLQRINADVVTVAYPLLEETGELLQSRLTTPRLTSLEPDFKE